MFLAPSCGQTVSTLLINTIQLRGRQLRETKNIWVNVLLHDARVETRDDALRLSYGNEGILGRSDLLISLQQWNVLILVCKS